MELFDHNLGQSYFLNARYVYYLDVVSSSVNSIPTT